MKIVDRGSSVLLCSPKRGKRGGRTGDKGSAEMVFSGEHEGRRQSREKPGAEGEDVRTCVAHLQKFETCYRPLHGCVLVMHLSLLE